MHRNSNVGFSADPGGHRVMDTAVDLVVGKVLWSGINMLRNRRSLKAAKDFMFLGLPSTEFIDVLFCQNPSLHVPPLDQTLKVLKLFVVFSENIDLMGEIIQADHLVEKTFSPREMLVRTQEVYSLPKAKFLNFCLLFHEKD